MSSSDLAGSLLLHSVGYVSLPGFRHRPSLSMRGESKNLQTCLKTPGGGHQYLAVPQGHGKLGQRVWNPNGIVQRLRLALTSSIPSLPLGENSCILGIPILEDMLLWPSGGT